MSKQTEAVDWILGPNPFLHCSSDAYWSAQVALYGAVCLCSAIAQDVAANADPELALRLEEVALRCSDALSDYRRILHERGEPA